MYLWYILVITYMFSVNVQAIMTSSLTTHSVHLPDLSPVVMECLPLELSGQNTYKSWRPPTTWRNAVKSHEICILKYNTVITLNVASKHYSLLQVLVAALLLVSCAAIVMRYPHPLTANKYFLRIDNNFYPLTCPNKLFFNQYIGQCTLNANSNLPVITLLNGNHCNENKTGYYCFTPYSFTYCTNDGLKIIDNANCPGTQSCPGTPPTIPCTLHLWYTCSK
jgi:hypothetical protein